MDELDIRIIKELEFNVRQSSRQLGKKLGINHNTIRRRINNLLKNNDLQIVAVPNWVSLGYHIWVVIMLNVKQSFSRKIADTLVNYPECYSVSETMGRFDIHIGAHFKSIEDLTDFVNNKLYEFEGIERVETALLTRPHKYFHMVHTYNQ